MKDKNIQQPTELHASLHKAISVPRTAEAGPANVTSLIQISKIYTQLLDEAFAELQQTINVHRPAGEKITSSQVNSHDHETHSTASHVIKKTERLTGIMKDIRKYFQHHHPKGPG
jgi:hypothetical protein